MVLVSLVRYPVPINISSWWNIGSVLGLVFLFQTISGFIITASYSNSAREAFNSVYITTERVNNLGWFFHSMHANGASFFFIFLYLHVFRGLYHGSFIVHRGAWYVGVLMVFLSMGTAFTGYVLPWSQMSYWAATVITSIASIFPIYGNEIVEIIWGDYVVTERLLKRFYTLHWLIPFVLWVLVGLHLWLVHRRGAGSVFNPNTEKIPFFPVFLYQDLVGFFFLGFFFAFVTCLYPRLFLDPLHILPADPQHTPHSIVPEWYFLPFYAILRSIPHNTGGIVLIFFAIFQLWMIAYNPLSNRINNTYHALPVFLWGIVAVILGIVGVSPPLGYFLFIGRVFTVLYFVLGYVLCYTSPFTLKDFPTQDNPFFSVWVRSYDPLYRKFVLNN